MSGKVAKRIRRLVELNGTNGTYRFAKKEYSKLSRADKRKVSRFLIAVYR